jgi:hypothetical protein
MEPSTFTRALGKHVRVDFAKRAGYAPLFGAEGQFEADVFAVDAALAQVVFRRAHAHTSSKADYFVVAIAGISALEVLRDSEALPAGWVPPNLGSAVVQKRLADARGREERRLEMQGAGVTEQEQRLFDELVKQCVVCARATPLPPPPIASPSPHSPLLPIPPRAPQPDGTARHLPAPTPARPPLPPQLSHSTMGGQKYAPQRHSNVEAPLHCG